MKVDHLLKFMDTMLNVHMEVSYSWQWDWMPIINYILLYMLLLMLKTITYDDDSCMLYMDPSILEYIRGHFIS